MSVSGWGPLTMAMVLGPSLRGAAQSVLTSLTLGHRRDYRVLVEALKQNISPAQQVHTYMAALKNRKRKHHEPLDDLGCDNAPLVPLAYPQANQDTKEAIGINGLMDSLPRPAIETRLHVIKGQPTYGHGG